jgi:serine/threonine protein kinase
VWGATSSLDSSTKSKILDSFPDRKPILRQSAEAVAFLHSFGIIHRNIKPSNLLFSQVAPDRYLVKLTDMQFSKNFKESPQNSGTCDPEWLAPEMLKKGSVLDSRTDCHLLGCLFFYVLSEGKHLFDGKAGRVANILHGNAESLTKDALKNEQVYHLIQRMVDKERTKRPTDKEVLEDDYFQLVDCYDLYKEGTKPGMCYIFNQRDMVDDKVSFLVAICLLIKSDMKVITCFRPTGKEGNARWNR